MDDKKKLIVVISLAVVVVGVGAFQFSSVKGPSENSSVKAKADQEKKLDAERKNKSELVATVPNPMFAAKLPDRDPFAPGSLNAADDGKKTTSTQPPTNRQPRTDTITSPPVIPQVGQLPGTTPGGNIGIQPGTSLRQPDEFAYTLKGVMVGDRPAAVLQDDRGSQKLVPLGGSVDGDSRVIGIARDKVTVRHKGKTVTLTVGANSK